MTSMLFKDIVIKDKGLLRGPFGGALKKEIFVPKSETTYKVYEQGPVLNKDWTIGRYYITEDYFKKMKNFECKPGDFLVSCSGVNYGAIYRLPEGCERGIINQALLRIRVDETVIDPLYFYYLFQSLISRIITTSGGDSTIPNFPSIESIKKIQVNLPDMATQQKIGKLLQNIDNLISKNKEKINLINSYIAKQYDYWFKQFDFPNNEGNPYKSSKGKMVECSEINRSIPDGWSVKTLIEVFSYELGTEFGAENYLPKGKDTIPFFRVSDMCENACAFVSNNANGSLATFGDVMVSFDATIGRVSITVDGFYSSGMKKIVFENKDYNPFVYATFSDKWMNKKLNTASGGFSVLKHASGQLKFIKIPYNREVFIMFSKEIKKDYDLLVNLYKENFELQKYKCFIQPMLLSGHSFLSK